MILVGFALAPGMVAQFEAGAKVSVGEQRRPHSCAQREGKLDAVALNGAVTLHGGIVGYPHRLSPALFELGFQGETHPTGMQIRRGPRDALFDDARKTDGNPVEAGKQAVQLLEPAEHRLRSWDFRSDDALPLADRLSGGVQKHGFEAGAADVDGERDG